MFVGVCRKQGKPVLCIELDRGTTGTHVRDMIHVRCPGLGQRMSETAKDHRQLMECHCEPSFARGVGATQALFDCSEAEVDHVQKELLVCSNLVRVFHNNTQHNNTQSIFCCFLRVIGDRAERDLFDCSIWGNAIESQVAGWPPFPVPASKHNKFSVTCAPHHRKRTSALHNVFAYCTCAAYLKCMVDTRYCSSFVSKPVQSASDIEDEIERSKHETQLRLIQSIVTLLHQAPWDQIDGVYIEIRVLGRRIECQILGSEFQFGHGIYNAIS